MIHGDFAPAGYAAPGTWNDVYSKPSNYTFGVVEFGMLGFIPSDLPEDPTSEVPEPAYLTFVGLGLCGLVAWRKRAKRASRET